MPATLGLVALGRWLDQGLRDPLGWSAARLAALTLIAGAVSPAGLDNITSVFRIGSAAGLIQEWGPSRPPRDVGSRPCCSGSSSSSPGVDPLGFPAARCW